jgi:hypothetical protein
VDITTNDRGTGFTDFTAGGSLVVRRTTGGAKTITATGATSGASASTTFTVRTAVAFYTSQTSPTSFSILGTIPTAIFVEGYGFPIGTIPANSITIGGVSTSHSAVTVGASGTFGIGAGGHVLVSPNANIPFGPVEEVRIAGISFSFDAGNIICNVSREGACPTAPGPVVGGVALGWGAPLISSAPGTASSTAVVRLNKAAFRPGDGDESMALFGYGFCAPATPCFAAITIPDPPGFNFVPDTTEADGNGAFWLLSDSDPATPAVPDTGMGEVRAGEYTVAVTGGGVLNVVQPTYRTQAWVQAPNFPSPTVRHYKQPIGNVIVHGFTQGRTVTVRIGTQTVVGPIVAGDGKAIIPVGPIDLAGGSYDIVAADDATPPVSATAPGAVIIRPRVDPDPGPPVNNALTINQGGEGTFTVLRSGATFGVHGLSPNTEYRIHWGLDPAARVIRSFRTDERGQIPAPGVQFSVPGGTVGIHILVIRDATGADVLFTTTIGHTPSSLGPDGRYGDLLFRLEVSLTTTPSVGGVGTTVGLSGSGLRPSTRYVITITTDPLPGGATGQIYANFTSTAAGAVPAGFSFTFPELPTIVGNEKGTTYFIHVSTVDQYPGNHDGVARFVLQATATLDKTVANPGDTVTISAKGLAALTTYTVQFGFKTLTGPAPDPGTTVASLVSNTAGTASATFTIPSGAAAGTYTIQLVRTAGPDPRDALVIAPTIQVGAVTAAGQVDTTTFQNTAKSDKTSYRPGETVTISADLRVESGTGRVNFVVTIKDAAGNVILVNKMANVPLTTDPVTLTVQTTITKPGTYTANIQVLTPADVPIAFKNVTFTVG